MHNRSQGRLFSNMSKCTCTGFIWNGVDEWCNAPLSNLPVFVDEETYPFIPFTFGFTFMSEIMHVRPPLVMTWWKSSSHCMSVIYLIPLSQIGACFCASLSSSTTVYPQIPSWASFFFEKMFTASALPAFKVYLPNFQTTHIMFPSLTIFQMLSICAFKSDSTQCRKLPSLYNIRTNRLIYVARDVPKVRRARHSWKIP